MIALSRESSSSIVHPRGFLPNDSAYYYAVCELTMLARINGLTDLSDYRQQKIFDSVFTFEWKSARFVTGYDVIRSMADWIGRSTLSVRIPNDSQCVEEFKRHTHDSIASGLIPSSDGGII